MADKIQFKNPPVLEVVCGVVFSELRGMKAPHLGAYWDLIRDKFSNVDEAPPLLPPAPPGGEVTYTFEPTSLPRIWFYSEDGRGLIQVQRDRFLFNWKRADADTETEYPSFDKIFPEFVCHLDNFKKFVSEQGWGDLEFKNFEMTYVNHIGNESAKPVVGAQVGDVLVDHVFDTRQDRFLPYPVGFKWNASFDMPDNAGRLSMTAGTATRTDTDEQVLRLEMVASGIWEDKSDDGLKAWFELAHEWITHGFVDLTSEEMHKKAWGRIK